MAHLHGGGLEASVSHHMGFSTGLSEDFHNMVAGFPRVNDPRENEAKIIMSFIT